MKRDGAGAALVRIAARHAKGCCFDGCGFAPTRTGLLHLRPFEIADRR